MRKEFTFQINGKDYTLGRRTWIAGIINVTPDSFSDGDLYFDKDKAIEKGLELVLEGSDIIDIGGESSKPGAETISVEEEIRRVIPVISALRKRIDLPISIDTTKSEVAEAALAAGADIINDISSLRFDPRMGPLAAQKDVPVILMHMKGTPKTMQLNPSYENVVSEVMAFLKERLKAAETYGIKKEKLIIDPGIGFGKRFDDNLTLLNNLRALEELERPILVGTSRKSFIGKIMNVPPRERLEGTIATAILSIMNGAHILRVHDVASVKKAILVAEAIMNENMPSRSNEENKDRKRSYVF